MAQGWGEGELPYKRLMGMCRSMGLTTGLTIMGSHFQ